MQSHFQSSLAWLERNLVVRESPQAMVLTLGSPEHISVRVNHREKGLQVWSNDSIFCILNIQ